MGDLSVFNTNIEVIGTIASPVTLTAGYAVANSGVFSVGRSRFVELMVNYTMGSAETGNSIQLKYELMNEITTDGGTATITGQTISFTDDDPDTIADSGNAMLSSGFSAGDVVRVTGSASNDGWFTVESVAAGALTLVSTDEVTAESAGASVTVTARTSPPARLQTESAVSGTVTRTYREDTFTAVAAAATYDRFAVRLEDLTADYLKVWVKETGKATNFGSCFVIGNKLGR